MNRRIPWHRKTVEAEISRLLRARDQSGDCYERGKLMQKINVRRAVLQQIETLKMERRMTGVDAIRELHAAMDRCNQCGWVMTGTIQFVKPRQPAFCRRNKVEANHGTLDDGNGPVETATMTARVEPIKAVLVPVTPPGEVRDGSICTTCSGTFFRRAGSCLFCTNCGTSVGGCG